MGKQDSATEYPANFTWNDKGHTITLKENSQPVSYFVGENTMTQLDMSGNKITGEHAGNYV